MFRLLVSGSPERALQAVRLAVRVVGGLFWLTGWAVAWQQAPSDGMAAWLCWSAGPVVWVAWAIGHGVGWRRAAWSLAVGCTAVIGLLGWTEGLDPAAVLPNMLILVVYVGWALGLQFAVLWAIGMMALALAFQWRGYTTSMQTLPFIHCLALTVWVLRRVYGHAFEQLQAMQRSMHLAQAQSQKLTLLSQALDQSPESVAIVDFDSRLVYANKAFERMTGYLRDDVLGRNAVPISVSGLTEPERLKMRQIVEAGQVWTSVLYNVRKDGQQVAESVSIAPIQDAQGRVTHFIQVKQDMRERLENEQRIDRLQNLDEVTQLPNLSALMRRIESLLLQQSLTEIDAVMPLRWHGLLLLEMNNFSDFQDARGLAEGDALRKAMAARMAELLPPGAWLASPQAGRFAVVYEGVGYNEAHALRTMHSLAFELRSGMRHLQVACPEQGAQGPDAIVWPIRASIGFTLFVLDAPVVQKEGAGYVLRCARIALKQAKSLGADHGHIRAYSDDMGDTAQRKLQMESDLGAALLSAEPAQLQLYVQPQVAWNGAVHSVEALLRWHHPQAGWVSPAEFIPLAENTGLIVELGDWVLQQVCQLLAHPVVVQGGYGVSANISALQLVQSDFVPKLQTLLAATGIQPDRLTLEVTESALLDDVDAALRKMHALTALGVQLALDDFGTGYSSLSYLKQLPIHEIKMDQSFIRDLEPSGVSGALVEAVLMIASRKGLRVVAEGVETEEQAELLRALEPSVLCQGYWFSRPMPAAQWLSNPQLVPGGAAQVPPP